MDIKGKSREKDELIKILAEFLEVAINSIIFLKQIYPSGAFERRRYMNIAVQKARHPELHDYIHSAVECLHPFLAKVDCHCEKCYIIAVHYVFFTVHMSVHPDLQVEKRPFCAGITKKGLVERVVVIFYDKAHVPTEKFIFKLSLNQPSNLNVEEAGLEFALRSFLIKLSMTESVTRALPAECQWEIAAYFRSLPSADSGTKEAKMWVPTDTKQWQHLPVITPIKSMNSEPLTLQLYLEHPEHPQS